MTTIDALWFMLSLGALSALGLAGCCTLVFRLAPRPVRAGFEIRYEHLPVARDDH